MSLEDYKKIIDSPNIYTNYCHLSRDVEYIDTYDNEWHDNYKWFDRHKIFYFQTPLDNSMMGYNGVPRKYFHFPECAIILYKNEEESVIYLTYENDIEFVLDSLIYCTAVIKYLKDKKISCIPQKNEKNLDTSIVIMGWDHFKHALLPGDVIVIQDDSCFSIMSDNIKWDYHFHNKNSPYLCTYMYRKESIDPDDSTTIVSYIAIDENNKKIVFEPMDIVKNIRYNVQNRACIIIQNFWRDWTKKRKNYAAVIIQRKWRELFYKPCSGKGYELVLQNFKEITK